MPHHVQPWHEWEESHGLDAPPRKRQMMRCCRRVCHLFNLDLLRNKLQPRRSKSSRKLASTPDRKKLY